MEDPLSTTNHRTQTTVMSAGSRRQDWIGAIRGFQKAFYDASELWNKRWSIEVVGVTNGERSIAGVIEMVGVVN